MSHLDPYRRPGDRLDRPAPDSADRPTPDSADWPPQADWPPGEDRADEESAGWAARGGAGWSPRESPEDTGDDPGGAQSGRHRARHAAAAPDPYPAEPGSYLGEPGSYPAEPGSYPTGSGSYPAEPGSYAAGSGYPAPDGYPAQSDHPAWSDHPVRDGYPDQPSSPDNYRLPRTGSGWNQPTAGHAPSAHLPSGPAPAGAPSSPEAEGWGGSAGSQDSWDGLEGQRGGRDWTGGEGSRGWDSAERQRRDWDTAESQRGERDSAEDSRGGWNAFGGSRSGWDGGGGWDSSTGPDAGGGRDQNYAGDAYAHGAYAHDAVAQDVAVPQDIAGPEFVRSEFAGPEFAASEFVRSEFVEPEFAEPGGGADRGDRRRPSRAGRNLPAAIGVSVTMGAAVLSALFLWKPAFLGVVVVAVCVAIWELSRAVGHSGAHPPLVPLLIGGSLMAGAAWYEGPDALCAGLLVTVLAAMVWRLADGPAGYQRDLTATTLVAVYVPFLGGFAALLAVPDDGVLRVVATLVAVVLSDTGGYVAGVFFGKHPMAPTVSPKKSWEGLAGSLVATTLGSALLIYFLFDVAPWWGGLFGLGISIAAVLGDLAESMLKRDLGVKDMSNLLPGHGGLMDRLDSILFALPTAYLLLSVLAPSSG